MIPCEEKDLEKINISKIKDEKYKSLLSKQYKIIKYELHDKIILKAHKLYNKKISNPDDFVSKLCCDFLKLEQSMKKEEN